jgi:type VI secretion system protein VasG
VAIGLNTSPSAVEEATRHIGRIDREMKILQREELIGHEHVERLQSLTTEKEAAQVRLDDLTQKWQKEMEIANHVIDVQKEIQEIDKKDPSDKQALSEKQDTLKGLKKELAEAQGDLPLVQIDVDSQIISEVISGWTGIPTGRMLTDEIETVLNMAMHWRP